MADFRLPISTTSTHKSVSPAALTFITGNGNVVYDGSVAKSIDLSNASSTGIHSQLFCVENTSNQHAVQLVWNADTAALDFNFLLEQTR